MSKKKRSGSYVRQVRKTQPAVTLSMTAGRSYIRVKRQTFDLHTSSDMKDAWKLVKNALFTEKEQRDFYNDQWRKGQLKHNKKAKASTETAPALGMAA